MDKNPYSFESRVYGCILGGYVGDAIGAHVEFAPIYVEGADLNHALKMYGGGVHKIGPGQVTDDTEMSMSLIWALIFCNQSLYPDDDKVINFDTIAQFYVKWLRSKPFDIDSAATYALDSYERNMKVANACQLIKNAQKYN